MFFTRSGDFVSHVLKLHLAASLFQLESHHSCQISPFWCESLEGCLQKNTQDVTELLPFLVNYIQGLRTHIGSSFVGKRPIPLQRDHPPETFLWRLRHCRHVCF